MGIFNNRQNLAILKKMQANLHRIAYSKLPVYYKTSHTLFDPLYGEESKYDPFSGDRYLIPAYVRISPQRSEWTKFGIEERREVKVVFSTQILKEGYIPDGERERTPFPDPTVGSVIEVQGDPYIVTDIIPQDYFANTQEYMTLIAFGIKWRPSSLKNKELALSSEDAVPPTSTYREDLYS